MFQKQCTVTEADAAHPVCGSVELRTKFSGYFEIIRSGTGMC